MRKLSILFCIIFAVMASGCASFAADRGPSQAENIPSVNRDDGLPREEGGGFDDCEEGGDGCAVFCRYVFSDSDEFLTFYDAFKLNNGARFLFPLSDDEVLSVRYLFTAEGVDGKDFHSSNYAIEYPYPDLNIEFSVEDRGTVFAAKTFYATYRSADISGLKSDTGVGFSYSLEAQEAFVEIGGRQVARFPFTYSNYSTEEVVAILERIEKLFQGGAEYAF